MKGQEKVTLLSARSSLFHPNRRLLEEGKRLGLEVELLHPKDLMVSGDGVLYRKGMAYETKVVLVRIGATINPYCMALIRSMEDLDIRVISRCNAIERSKHKSLSLVSLKKAGINTPLTILVSNRENLLKAIRVLGGLPVVVKDPSGRQGEGVWLVQDQGGIEAALQRLIPQVKGVVVQEFIDPKKRRDIRCLVVGGKVIAAMELIPRKDEFRSNYHMGAKAISLQITRDLEVLSSAAAEALGLDVAGVDLMVTDKGIMVVEVNYSPGFRGLEKVTGINVAKAIMEYVMKITGD